MAYARPMTSPVGTSRPLQVAVRPRIAHVAWVALFVVGVLLLWWYTTHPAELETSDDPVSASTPAGGPVYIGVVVPAADFGRTLHLAGVKVSTVSDTPVTVTPLLCRGGTVKVTTTPEPFCTELVDPQGEPLSAGSAIVLRLEAEEPGTARVDRVRLAYRDGLQWATQEAGSPATVEFLSR